MKLTLKKVAAAVALALAAPAAMALDSPSTPAQNGSLFLTVFDVVKGNSLVQVLQPTTSFGDGTLNFSEFGEAVATPNAGLTLNFNVDLSFFTNNGSSLSDLRYTVFAGDNTGALDPDNEDPQPGIQSILFTSATTPTGLTTGKINSINTVATSIALSVPGLLGTGTTTPPTGTYLGGDFWGARLGLNLTSSAAGALGTSLGFYYGTMQFPNSGDAAQVQRYQNVNGNASWTLSNAGLLTYSVPGGTEVPLPAAVWLLLSGVGGLGVLGRRRRLAAA